jgi:hypothetical protein
MIQGCALAKLKTRLERRRYKWRILSRTKYPDFTEPCDASDIRGNVSGIALAF